MSETFICSICHEEHTTEECTIFDGKLLCPDCLEEYTCICDHCDTRIWQDDSHCDEHIILCQSCLDNYYETCSDCGRLVETSSLLYRPGNSYDGYCESCYQLHIQEQGIQTYSYKPDPIFYGDGPRFFGVELEVDGAGECDSYANMLLSVGNTTHDHIYIKHDGSLDDGLEIVTHPMSLDYHRKEMPWINIIQKALTLGYISHKAGTCGLHIHVNRSSLGSCYEEQEDTIARILYLVENYWHEFLRFSRRTQEQMDHWASRYGRKDDPKSVLYSAKTSGDRYTCVNLTPDYTIEFRMFRGTLKYNTLIATLQMVDHLCNVAFHMTDEMVPNITWSEFVSGLRKETTPELIQYLKERRLYVSEPVDASEEV